MNCFVILVVESHPDNTHEDLRLDRPFPGLAKFADELDLDSMSKKDHMHTPWLIIIYKYLQKWKEQVMMDTNNCHEF